MAQYYVGKSLHHHSDDKGRVCATEIGATQDSHDSTCRLVNLAVPPGLKFRKSAAPFVRMENISNFLAACRLPPLSLQEHDVFLTVDLYERKDPAQILQCLAAFSRRANAVQPTKFPRVIGPRDKSSQQQTDTTIRSSSTNLPLDDSSSRDVSTPVTTRTSSNTISPYGYNNIVNNRRIGTTYGHQRRETTTTTTYSTNNSRTPTFEEKERQRRAQEDRKQLEFGRATEEAERQQQAELELEEHQAKADEWRRRAEETRKLRAEETRSARKGRRRTLGREPEDQRDVEDSRIAEDTRAEEMRVEEARRKWQEKEREIEQQMEMVKQREYEERLQQDRQEREERMEFERAQEQRLRQERLLQREAEEEAQENLERERRRELEVRHEKERQAEKQKEQEQKQKQEQLKREEEGRLAREIEQEKQRERATSDSTRDNRLNGQFLSQYQATRETPRRKPVPSIPSTHVPPSQSTPESERVKQLERQLEEAKQREKLYQDQLQTHSTGDSGGSPVPKNSGFDLAQEDERLALQSEWQIQQDNRPIGPPQFSSRRSMASPPLPPRTTPTSTRPLPDSIGYTTSRTQQSSQNRIDRFLMTNPAPSPPRVRTYHADQFGSTAEVDAENARRVASTQKTRASGWASKSLLEREMERERQRQAEWEAERQAAKAAVSGSPSPSNGNKRGLKPLGPRPPL